MFNAGTVLRRMQLSEGSYPLFLQVKQIINIDLTNNQPELPYSTNYFVFSFNMRGMNFSDMMKLEWKNIEGKNIYHTRSKTMGNFTIKLLLHVQKILGYDGKNSFDTKYVHPILLKEKLTTNKFVNRKTTLIKNYNKDLKIIAELDKIEKSVTRYITHHGFTNSLNQKMFL